MIFRRCRSWLDQASVFHERHRYLTQVWSVPCVRPLLRFPRPLLFFLHCLMSITVIDRYTLVPTHLTRSVKRQLEPEWHRVSFKTKQVINEHYAIHAMLLLLQSLIPTVVATAVVSGVTIAVFTDGCHETVTAVTDTFASWCYDSCGHQCHTADAIPLLR